MEYQITTKKIKELLELITKDKINLNPPYQRNSIWTKKAQKALIFSISSNSPIPNIFLLSKDDKFEVVDGQQRLRALYLYATSNEIDLTKNDDVFKKEKFLEYEIPVTIITKLEEGEYIEEFYDRVNSSGLKLNRPETVKGKYFQTKFFGLVQEITELPEFQKLEIIPVNSQKRMMDRDLVEELCALVLFGITEKKLQVDKLYETDIIDNQYDTIKVTFHQILQRIDELNTNSPIKNSRYRQRNDFYTLFGFIKDNLNIEMDTLKYFYSLMIQFEKGIRPSKTACKPLAEYAFNCVSQSNSSTARQARVGILNELLENLEPKPNESQNDVIEYYSVEPKDLNQIESFYTFELNALTQAIDSKLSNEMSQ